VKDLSVQETILLHLKDGSRKKRNRVRDEVVEESLRERYL